MSDITTAGALIGALVFAIVNFIRFINVKDWKSVRTQSIAWIIGIGVVFLLAGTQWSGEINLLGVTLAAANLNEKIILGLLAPSMYAPIAQAIKALDNTQSAAIRKAEDQPTSS